MVQGEFTHQRRALGQRWVVLLAVLVSCLFGPGLGNEARARESGSWLKKLLEAPPNLEAKVDQSGRARVLTLFVQMNELARRGDTDRLKRLFASVESEARSRDGVCRDVLLEVFEAAPAQAHRNNPMVRKLENLINRIEDPAFRMRRSEAIANRESRLFEKRMKDPVELAELLTTSDNQKELNRAISFVTTDEMQHAAVRTALEGIIEGRYQLDLREKALFPFVNIATLETAEFMGRVLEVEKDAKMRNAAFRVLSQIRHPEVAQKLIEILRTEQNKVARRFAAGGLGRQTSGQEVVGALIRACEADIDFMVRFRALMSLRRHAKIAAVGEYLLQVVQLEENPDLRAKAASILGESELPQVAAVLESVAKNDSSSAVRTYAEKALRRKRR